MQMVRRRRICGVIEFEGVMHKKLIDYIDQAVVGQTSNCRKSVSFVNYYAAYVTESIFSVVSTASFPCKKSESYENSNDKKK